MPRPAVRLLLCAITALSQFTTSRAASTLLLPSVDTPSGGSGAVVLEPVKQRAQPTRRLVYSCITPGHVMFADRPCGPAPTVRELKVAAPAPAAAGAAPDLAQAPPALPTSIRTPPAPATDGDDAAADERATTCQKLQAALDDVDARMRAGYSAREAGRLWERWRAAKARLQEARC